MWETKCQKFFGFILGEKTKKSRKKASKGLQIFFRIFFAAGIKKIIWSPEFSLLKKIFEKRSWK